MRNNFDLISELIDNRLAAISNKAEREQLFFFVFLLQRKKDIEELCSMTMEQMFEMINIDVNNLRRQTRGYN